MISIIRWFAGIIGAILLWCSVCLREDQEKIIHSVFSSLWLRVNALQEKAVPVHIALVAVAGRSVSRILDRIFGERLFTVQAISISWVLSFGSMILFSTIGSTTGFKALDAWGTFALFGVCVLLGIAARRIKWVGWISVGSAAPP